MLSATLFLLLTSCAVAPPDVPVFEYLPQHLATDPVTGHMILKASPDCEAQIGELECGHGVFIMSKKEIFVGEAPAHWYKGKPWSQLKRESIYLPAQESYAPLATYIINSCAKNNCNDQVSRFRVQLDELKGIGAILNPGIDALTHP